MSNHALIAPQFVAAGPTTLVLKEKKGLSLSGDSGKINDANGNLMFKIDANLLTISERRTLEDASGTKIGTVRVKKTPGLHMTYYLGTMSDDKKCAVKMKGLMNPTKCDADIYHGDTVIGEASGNWRAKSFTISLGGRQAAKVSRKTGLMGRVLDADSYIIEIEGATTVVVAASGGGSIAIGRLLDDDRDNVFLFTM
ncbi:hypothetical protein ACHAW5_006579 [Stephanodiscus triporus]|uniref:Uncharacterized protein n=1 Tax=Stephanodiscus triporus TaxID=2934178 RepID=A0ABD3QHG2_9STRA